jgi:putative flippase GtrA
LARAAAVQQLPLIGRYLPSRERFGQLAGWFALSVGAMVVELGLLRGLLAVGVVLWLGTALAAEVLILARFVIADRWVFGHARPTWARLAKYQSSCLGSLAVSWVVTNVAVELAHMDVNFAFLLASGTAFCWSVMTNFLWVWRHPKPAAT